MWIPNDAIFTEIFDFENVTVMSLDSMSALLSKAIKAPEKNKQLIRQAIASGEFPDLAERIIEYGGSLENFL